jgi:4-hydroxy-3-methylbut-2-enyl diphosphate reductase IspH
VGLSAGASTPDKVIDDIEQALLCPVTHRSAHELYYFSIENNTAKQ